jgi:DNA helicase-2/ATP-dependent DNA helicase PcrA
MTGGYFQSVEPIEASDGAAFLGRLEAATEGDRTRVIADFLGSVANVAAESDDMESVLVRCGGGTERGSPAAMAKAIDQAMACKAIKAHRGELLRACLDVMRSVDQFGVTSLVGRFRARRSAASRSGRRLATRVSGSTLLLKGMEFDHVIVVDSGGFSEYEWYVALTRGSKSLTVVSPSSTLTFSGVA